MLSAASLCVVGYPLLMRYTTLEGEEAAVLEEGAGSVLRDSAPLEAVAAYSCATAEGCVVAEVLE